MNLIKFTGNVNSHMKTDPISPKARKEYIKVAKELGYSDAVINALAAASTEIECDHIMHRARCCE